MLPKIGIYYQAGDRLYFIIMKQGNCMKILNLFTLLTLTLFIFSPELPAQDLPRFGIKAGYLSSNISVDKFDNFSERRDGFSVGVYSKILSVNAFSLLLQLDYSRKGYNEIQYETNNEGKLIQTVRANTRLDYLSIPILIEYAFDEITLKPYLVTGLRFDILIGKFNGVFNFSNSDFESRFADNLKNNSIGWRIAGGFNLAKISGLNLGLELFYDMDFTNSFGVNDYLVVRGNDFGISLTIN